MVAVAQHAGRPGVPADQAWIESRSGTLKTDWFHLLAITDLAVVRVELDSARVEYNSQRLYPGRRLHPPFSTSTEHEGRGPAIRKAHQDSLEQAPGNGLATTGDNDTVKPTQRTAMMSDATTRNGHQH